MQSGCLICECFAWLCSDKVWTTWLVILVQSRDSLITYIHYTTHFSIHHIIFQLQRTFICLHISNGLNTFPLFYLYLSYSYILLYKLLKLNTCQWVKQTSLLFNIQSFLLSIYSPRLTNWLIHCLFHEQTFLVSSWMYTYTFIKLGWNCLYLLILIF